MPKAPTARVTALAVAATALAGAGCGAEKSPDVATPSGSYSVELSDARFPADQHVSAPADLRLTVRNLSAETIPHLVVTLRTAGDGLPAGRGPFDVLEPRQESRPVWITSPGFPKELPGATSDAAAGRAADGSAQTGLVSTYSFDDLAPRRSRTLVWRVTPVRAGRYRVSYGLSASTSGAATLKAAGGGRLAGRFDVQVASTAPTAP